MGLGKPDCKCQVYSKSKRPDVEKWVELGLEEKNVLLPDQGLRAWGAPIGSDAFIRQWCIDYVEEQVKPKCAAVMKSEKMQDRVLFLRYCVNSTFTHLLRMVPPRLVADAALRFDELIHDTWEQACDLVGQVPIDSNEWTIANLQFKLGGLGFTRMHSIRHAAFFASELRMLHEDVRVFTPEIHVVYDDLHLVDSSVKGHSIRSDFQECWNTLHTDLGDGFLALLGDKADKLDPADVAHLRSIECLYPVNRGGKNGYNVALRHEKWQREITHAIHARELSSLETSKSPLAPNPDPFLKVPPPSNELLSVLRASQDKGGADVFTSIPTGCGPAGLELTNSAYHNYICYRLQLENVELHVPDFHDGLRPKCPLIAKSKKVCGKEVNDAHLRRCKTKINVPTLIHDVMNRNFWVPLLSTLLGGVEWEVPQLCQRSSKERRADKESIIRPGDLWWAFHIGLKWRGMDTSYTDPTSKRANNDVQKKKHYRTRSALCKGWHVKQTEVKKTKHLESIPPLFDGTSAQDVITPVVFALTGAWGKTGSAFFKSLAVIAHPGDDDDPEVKQMRSLWITHNRKVHTMMLVNTVHNFVVRKAISIRQALRRSAKGPAGELPKTSSRSIHPTALKPLPEHVIPDIDLGEGVPGLVLHDGASAGLSAADTSSFLVPTSQMV